MVSAAHGAASPSPIKPRINPPTPCKKMAIITYSLFICSRGTTPDSDFQYGTSSSRNLYSIFWPAPPQAHVPWMPIAHDTHTSAHCGVGWTGGQPVHGAGLRC